MTFSRGYPNSQSMLDLSTIKYSGAGDTIGVEDSNQHAFVA